MARHIYSDKEESFIRKQIEKRKHPQLWFMEFNKKFNVALTWDALFQKCKRMNLDTNGLTIETTKQINKKQKQIEKHEKTISMSDEDLRLEKAKEQAKIRIERFEKRELNRLRKKEQFEKQLIETIVEKSSVISRIPFKGKLIGKGDKPESFISVISDLHNGEVVDPDKIGGYNIFNPQVAEKRMEYLANKIVKIATVTVQGVKFDELVIPMLGDMVCGDIHQELVENSDVPIVKQVFHTIEMLKGLIYFVAPYFPKVRIHIVPGNHGRLDERKNYKYPEKNWDYVIGQVLKETIQDDRIIFDAPPSYSLTTKIKGFNFTLEHGDSIKSWAGIPFYGVTRWIDKATAKLKAMGEMFQYGLIGHFHMPLRIPSSGGHVLMNGAIKGMDEFADNLNSVKVYCPPTQWMFGVNTERTTWEYSIDLPTCLNKQKG